LTSYGTGAIGRADLDGQNVDPTFITGATFPYGVAVDSGRHVYWTNYHGDTIGRADLDGRDANQCFITSGSGRSGVAVGCG
jgi:hypothetical protein